MQPDQSSDQPPAPDSSQQDSSLSLVASQSSEPVIGAGDATKRRLNPKWLLVIALVLVLGGGGVYAAAQISSKRTHNAKSNQSLADVRYLLQDVSFVRYNNDAYDVEKVYNETTGKVEREISTRKESFDIQLERNGTATSIPIDKTVMEFGATTDGKLYTLSCTVPDEGQVGGNNPKFFMQLYDNTGQKGEVKEWQALDAAAPVSADSHCSAGDSDNKMFQMEVSERFDTAARNFGREAVDALNYSIVFINKDGAKKVIDTEVTSDIDIPLGVSPDQKKFIYTRISAKRTTFGCGGGLDLAYKIPDYDGPINELHVVDIETGKDTLIGPESSFSADGYPVNISSPGRFSPDSMRYYLETGLHQGCTDGDDPAIRIPYIDLTTNQFHTISSPEDKDYNAYKFNSDGTYIIETGVVGGVPSGEYEPYPTVLNPSTGATFTISDESAVNPEEYREAEIGSYEYINRLVGVFIGLGMTRQPDENGRLKAQALTKLYVLDPATRKISSVDLPGISVGTYPLESVGETVSGRAYYITRGRNTAADPTGWRPDVDLVDKGNGASTHVPYADIVL